VRRDERRDAPRESQRLVACARDVVPSRKAKETHARERDGLTTPGARWRHLWVVARWGVREARKRGGLGDADLRRRRAEVERTRCADADGPLPELYAVQVLLHDLLLAQARLETQRPYRLGDLAGPAPLGRMEQAGELHRDGRRA
jgi:hypothetical protein